MPRAAESESNGCATVEPSLARGLLITAIVGFTALPVTAQSVEPPGPAQAQPAQRENRATSGLWFLAGGVVGLAAHEFGHLAFNVAFDAKPSLDRVNFHGIPFFALTHRPGLPPRKELVISSAGFWVQHAGNEWILSRRPGLRHEQAPLLKGIVAFNVLTSAAYAGAAFARTGPWERDTRGIADAARIDERWVGALVLAPAALDAWRYFDPDARWPVWASRGAKVGMLLLLLR
jgi:hypothetical protein